MILLSKTEILFAITHVSYPTPQTYGSKIDEGTSREYPTKKCYKNVIKVNQIISYVDKKKSCLQLNLFSLILKYLVNYFYNNAQWLSSNIVHT